MAGILMDLMILASLIYTGSCANLIPGNEGRIEVQQGASVTLTCEVALEDAERIFPYIPRWEKCQDFQNKDKQGGSTENCWINLHHSIELVPKFADTGRYQLESIDTTTPKRIGFQLILSDVTVQDSGLYRCVVPTINVIQDNEVVVFSEISEVSMILATDSSMENGLMTNPRMMTFIQDVSGSIKCVTIGGYPKPVIEVFAGEKHLTGEMAPVTDIPEYELIGEELGLQEIRYTVGRFSDRVRFTRADDGKELKCIPKVEDKDGEIVDSDVVTTVISIDFKPIFVNCTDVWHTKNGRKDFEVSCRILSRPAPDKVEFIYKGTQNNPIIANAGPENDFEATSQLVGEYVVATLRITEMKPEYFSEYQLAAQNGQRLGRSIFNFLIVPGEGISDAATDDSSETQSLPAVMLLIFATLCVLLH